MFYRINWHAATRRILLESNANAAPAAIGGAYTNLGTIEHGPDADDDAGLPGMQEFPENHVIFHHVQDALYKAGVQGMSSIKIYLDRPRSISIGTGTLNVAVGANSAPLAATATPAGATDKEVTYTSSATNRATVNEQGVVHGVSAGSAVITAKLKSDETITATRNVTVA